MKTANVFCPNCQMGYIDKELLLLHIKARHEHVRSEACDQEAAELLRSAKSVGTVVAITGVYRKRLLRIKEGMQ